MVDDAVLFARSRREVELYLQLTPCSRCGRPSHNIRSPANSASSGEWIATCDRCHDAARVRFQLSGNPSDCSRLIDLAQWLTLFGLTIDAAKHEGEKTAARRLALEAANCLSEALRFYDDENDLPPDKAFFSDESRARFREHPQLFSRQRLLHLRGQLPTTSKFDSMDS